MMPRNRLLLVAGLVALLPAAAGAADVYRCVDNGVVTYQDAPCSNAGSGTVVRLPQEPPPPPGARGDAAQSNEALRKRVDAMARERRQREIATEIDGLDRQLTRIAAEEAAELSAVRDRRKFIANNLQGDPYGQGTLQRSLEDEMKQISAKYRDRSDAVRRRIMALRGESVALAKPAQ
jgi:hypothetical protein